MSKQLYYQDVDIGEEISPLVKEPTTTQLVMWAGASGDYNPIHYDKDFAQGRGLAGVIVPGQLTGAFLGQMMTDWIGEEGSLRRLSCSYKGMSYPGEKITCQGKVTRKYVEEGQELVGCKLWAENPKGENVATGTAIVVLPSKG
jgi:acyl dehydratase